MLIPVQASWRRGQASIIERRAGSKCLSLKNDQSGRHKSDLCTGYQLPQEAFQRAPAADDALARVDVVTPFRPCISFDPSSQDLLLLASIDGAICMPKNKGSHLCSGMMLCTVRELYSRILQRSVPAYRRIGLGVSKRVFVCCDDACKVGDHIHHLNDCLEYIYVSTPPHVHRCLPCRYLPLLQPTISYLPASGGRFS